MRSSNEETPAGTGDGTRGRCGFTIIELMFSAALVTVILIQVTYVMNAVSRSAQDDTAAGVLEDQAEEVLDRIAYAIMGSDRGTLNPDEEDLHYTSLDYKVSLGWDEALEDVVWDDPQQIALEQVESQVVWKENPDEEAERRVVWGKYVATLMEGEDFNGIDDNANGLIDEEGLHFVIDGDSVTVRLTLRRADAHGNPVSVKHDRVVTCRNFTPPDAAGAGAMSL